MQAVCLLPGVYSFFLHSHLTVSDSTRDFLDYNEVSSFSCQFFGLVDDAYIFFV